MTLLAARILLTHTSLRVLPTKPRNDHHPHKRPPTLKFNISATMGDIEAALAALSLLESPNYAQTAREFGLDRITLTRRFKGKQGLDRMLAFRVKVSSQNNRRKT